MKELHLRNIQIDRRAGVKGVVFAVIPAAFLGYLDATNHGLTQPAPDQDGDGVIDFEDRVPGPDLGDMDGDGVINRYDPDVDGDGVGNPDDFHPLTPFAPKIPRV